MVRMECWCWDSGTSYLRCLESSMRVTRGRVSRTPRHSLTAAAARGRRREHFVVLPSVASGSRLVSWRLVLGIASCRMITASCPLEGVAHSRRSPAVLTVDQRRRTNQLLPHRNNRNIVFFYQTVSTLLARISHLDESRL
jgi:hypothetical protein